MSELYIPRDRPTRNFVNGRFLKGHIPFNKGRKWKEYVGLKKQKKMLKGLLLGRKGNPSIGGRNAKGVVALKNGMLYSVYKSSYAAEEKTGICARNIRNCCAGKRKHAGGYLWFWEKDDKWINLIDNGK